MRALVRQGVLERVSHGVYVDAARAAQLIRGDSARQRLVFIAAAVAAAGRWAVASHEDAAVIHGLALLDRPRAGVYSVSVPVSSTRGRRRRSDVHLHTLALPAQQVTVRYGIPVTTVARTVIDLARALPFRAGVVVADSALHDSRTSKAELERVIWDCSRWPGIQNARRVVGFSDPLAESPFESIARVAFSDGGLPAPMLQVWIMGNVGAIGRVDFLWDEYRTIAEADGAIKYADPDRARQQLRRDAELRRAGYEVVHFTWRDLATTPDQVVQWIKVAFGRSAQLRMARRGRAG
jgi:hypothetical protein